MIAVRAVVFAVSVIGALLCGGCASTALPARRLDDAQLTTSKVTIRTARLHETVRAAAMRVERNDEHFLEIEVHVLNESDQLVAVQCHIVFRDHLNKDIEEHDEPPAVIAPRGTYVLQATARVVQAQDFIVDVREGPRR